MAEPRQQGWKGLAKWWLEERRADPAYGSTVVPLVKEALLASSGERVLDLGAGEGWLADALTARGVDVVGIDINQELAYLSGSVVGELPFIPFRDDSFDGAVAVLLVEHVADHVGLFGETARVVRPGGHFTIVSNHPTWTAPSSTPIQDSDGEILWRPGEYFSGEATAVEVEDGVVTFYHRSTSEILNGAADAGWSLEQMIERPHDQLERQCGIPRLIACRWRLLP